MNNEIFTELRERLAELTEKYDLGQNEVVINGTVLSVEEAIGNPERNDFPLQKGKESLMQASFRGSCGQAFTDMPRNFRGSIQEIVKRPVKDNYGRAVLISSFNAVLRSLNLCDHSVHCKDGEPRKCSEELVKMISATYGKPQIALFGLQPAMAEALAKQFALRIFDLDPDNIGKEKFGVTVESGECEMEEVESWANLFLVTGSSVCNGSILNFLNLKKPVIFFGTTIAGTAAIFELTRFCPFSS